MYRSWNGNTDRTTPLLAVASLSRTKDKKSRIFGLQEMTFDICTLRGNIPWGLSIVSSRLDIDLNIVHEAVTITTDARHELWTVSHG